MLVVELSDGRSISVPLEFYPTLLGASAGARRKWRLLGGGIGIEWPDLDLQLSTEGVVAGRREHVPRRGFAKWLRGRQERMGGVGQEA
jgi:hypothetical protein